MERISRSITVSIDANEAFKKFVEEFNQWWPKEYTWSGNMLKEIYIEAKLHGLCTEIGPYDFRSDWGQVTEINEDKKICIKWQIGSNREPVPDPAKASDVVVEFIEKENSTTVQFEHLNFENHGEDAQAYSSMMNSKSGWDYILEQYTKYCEGN